MSVTKLAVNATRQINAVVVSSGLMQNTVKVRVGEQKWDKHIGKHFNRTKHLLVHDPRSSLRTGDVISISPGWRYSKNVHHVVNSIIAPFGEPLEERPPIPSTEERILAKMDKRRAKLERKMERQRDEREKMSGQARGMEEVVVKGDEAKRKNDGPGRTAKQERKTSGEEGIKEDGGRDSKITVL